MCVAAAIAGSAVVGGIVQSNAASDAANAQVQASQNANATQMAMYDQAQANLAPFKNAGYTSLNSLMYGLGQPGYDSPSYAAPGVGYGSFTQPFGADQFNQYLDPGYQFQLQQGNMALQNSQAAKDGVLSGAALKDLIGYNQGMANTAYNSAFNRYQTQTGNTYQRLMGAAEMGQASAAGSAQNAIATGGNIGANQLAAGNAQAAGIVGSANAIGGAIVNAGGAAGYYMLNNMTNNPSTAATYTA